MAEDSIRDEVLQNGTQWLLEMELVESPNVKNFLIINTWNASKHIQDVDLIIDTNNKVMLCYIQLSWWGRFRKKEKDIETYLLEEYQRVLPSFKVRVTFDKNILELALKKAKYLRKGAKSEKSNTGNAGNILPKSSELRKPDNSDLNISSTSVKEQPRGTSDPSSGNPEGN